MLSATESRDHFAGADLCGKYLQGAPRPAEPPLMDWMTARCVDSVSHFSHARRRRYRRASDLAPIPLKGHPPPPPPLNRVSPRDGSHLGGRFAGEAGRDLAEPGHAGKRRGSPVDRRDKN